VRFGRPHRHYRRCDSTNTQARQLAAAGAPSGLVVTAEEQTAGRGRQGRTWVTPAGKALLYSALLRPLEERHLLLPLAVPLAVCDAAERLGGGRCRVKWPNDVLIDDRKCAGVLIEARPRDGWAVIGVGINLSIEEDEFPPELRGTATSLGSAEPGAALAALNERLGAWVEAGPGEVLGEFRRRDALRGREVAWEGGDGTAEGVDDRGNLLVRRADGEVESLGAGEVHLRDQLGGAR
jgi:BirA family transcriptional regulator, biotin operon repressor / biotin---[acetyl-CoA-carboxylase] ligase